MRVIIVEAGNRKPKNRLAERLKQFKNESAKSKKLSRKARLLRLLTRD